MSVGLDKCAILLIANGKYTTINICMEIPKLNDDESKGYRYLGIMEGVDFHMDEVKGELRKLNAKTQKMLTMKGIHNPKVNVHQLYLHHVKEGHGLTGVEGTYNCKCAALAAHVCNSTNTLTQ
eukprot:12359487-Ditylum_brightwellii.AAC.1